MAQRKQRVVKAVKPGKPPRPICGAKTRKGGKCERTPMANGRCYMHGGSTPTKTEQADAQPHRLQHIRYQSAFPKDLMERAAMVAGEGDLLDLGPNLELNDAMLADAMVALDGVGSVALCGVLQEAYAAYRQTKHGTPAREDKLTALLDLFENAKGRADKIQQQILRLQEARRRLTDTDIKRQASPLTTVSVDQIKMLMVAIAEMTGRVFKEPIAAHLPTRDAFMQWMEEFRALGSMPGQPEPKPTALAPVKGNGNT